MPTRSLSGIFISLDGTTNKCVPLESLVPIKTQFIFGSIILSAKLHAGRALKSLREDFFLQNVPYNTEIAAYISPFLHDRSPEKTEQEKIPAILILRLIFEPSF